MAVTYATSLKNTRMNAVKTAIDAGGAPGYIEIGTAAMAATLVTITLANPSAGNAVNGVLTFSGTPLSATATGAGTAAAARIRTSAASDVVTGLTVDQTGGTADIILDNKVIGVGQTVTIQSATITHG